VPLALSPNESVLIHLSTPITNRLDVYIWIELWKPMV